MLSTLRSKSGGWIAKIFIGLLAASFAVWGIEDMLRGRISDVLARVGDREIGVEQYRDAFNRQLSVYSRQLGETITPDRARELGLDRQILGDLMREAALDHQAREMGVSMPARAVAQRIADSPQFKSADGTFNPTAFRNLLRANGLSEEQFLAIEAESMTRDVVAQPLTTQVVVPDTLVELIWTHRTEQRDAKYFTFTVTPDATEPSDAELKALYDENPAAFTVPERRTFMVLDLSPAAIASTIQISDEGLMRHYEARKAADYSTPEKRKVLQIPFDSEADAQAAADRLKSGADFIEIAAEKGLNEADISLGTVTKQEIPDSAIAEAAFALEDGAVSAPVKGRLSTVLLKAEVVEPGSTQPFEDVRSDVEAKVRQLKARDALLDVHDKFEDARAGGASMEEAAREIGLQLQEVGPVALDGTDAQGRTVTVPGHPSTLKTAFETEVGLEISPLTSGDDGFTWIEVRDVEPSRTPPFNEVRDEVAEAWKARRAATATRKKAEELVKRLKAGTAIEELAQQEGASVQTVTGARRAEASDAFTAGDVSALFSVKADGVTYSLDNDGRSAKIIASSPVLGPGFDPNSDEAKAIREVLQTSLSNDLYAEYVNALQAKIGVSIDDAAWARLSGGGY